MPHNNIRDIHEFKSRDWLTKNCHKVKQFVFTQFKDSRQVKMNNDQVMTLKLDSKAQIQTENHNSLFPQPPRTWQEKFSAAFTHM